MVAITGNIPVGAMDVVDRRSLRLAIPVVKPIFILRDIRARENESNSGPVAGRSEV